MPSQQSSFIGMRTALMRQVFITSTEAASVCPSKTAQPCWQAYSVPEWLTPWICTTCPLAFMSLLPCTCRGDVPVAGPGVAVGPGVGVGGGAGVVAGHTTEGTTPSTATGVASSGVVVFTPENASMTPDHVLSAEPLHV